MLCLPLYMLILCFQIINNIQNTLLVYYRLIIMRCITPHTGINFLVDDYRTVHLSDY